MTDPRRIRSVCWKALWNERLPDSGLEQLLLGEASARSTVLAFDEAGQPFSLRYELQWDPQWRLRAADLEVERASGSRALHLRTDGKGHWFDGLEQPLSDLDGCIDIDIWPTPFTNSFPIRRAALTVGERREFRVAWVVAPELDVKPQLQAYTRLGDRSWRFENLDGSGFEVDLEVDADGLVLAYPGLFERVQAGA